MREPRSRQVLALIAPVLAAAIATLSCGKDAGPGPGSTGGSGGGMSSSGGGGSGGRGGTTGAGGVTGSGGNAPAGSGGSPSSGGDAGPTSDAAPTTCASLRNCLTSCNDNAACKQGCMNRASAKAKSDYAPVQMCSMAGCAEDDVLCRCPRECNGGGECDEAVITCRDLEDDVFCDEICR
ncbi:MAG TPA: hypothetical protein VGF45_13740 [Polyangia bacterium]